jgi:DNA-binding NtrC family response regulator
MMRPMKGVLVSWLGRTDLRAVTDNDQLGVGLIAQALRTGGFSRLELLCDCPVDEAETYMDWLRAQTEARVVPHLVTLPSPTDFDAIYRNARPVAAQAVADAGGQAEHLTFHLSPGTPAMAAVWIILAKTGFPAELIESELFGHENGAFTGAISVRKGVFEAALSGTLFLDEIGELPKPAQVRFLRALQEDEVTRVGATESIQVDVRIIAATNRSLTAEVSAGRFREDLFYRLAVAVIALPPLRERNGDAALLLDRLLDQINRESATEPGFEPKKLSVTARNLLLDHPWPGNVREMLNTLRRAAVWTPGPVIDVDDASDALLPCPAGSEGREPVLSQDVRQGIDLNGIIDRVARHYLEQAMEITGGNKTRAAKLLGFGNPTTLTNWLKRHGVEP